MENVHSVALPSTNKETYDELLLFDEPARDMIAKEGRFDGNKVW